MKIRHRTGPIDATRAQTVRQSLHSGQVRAHTRTSRMVLRFHVQLLLLLLLRVVLLLLRVHRPRVSLLAVVAVVQLVSIRVLLHLVWMLVVCVWPRMPAVVVMVLVVHAQRVQGVWRGFASGCIG